MNWISLGEKLPEDNQLVNICFRDEYSERYYTARYHKFCNCFQFWISDMKFTFESQQIAFWKPLESLDEEYERTRKEHKVVKNF